MKFFEIRKIEKKFFSHKWQKKANSAFVKKEHFVPFLLVQKQGKTLLRTLPILRPAMCKIVPNDGKKSTSEKFFLP